MKRSLLASAALVALMAAGPAMAADMPVKAIADPWVGFYVGGNLGYSWGSIDTTTSVAPFTQSNFQNNFFTFTFPGGASSTSLGPSGVIGGGQAGYIWRMAPHWLAGIEADYQWSGEKDSGSGAFLGNTTNCTSGNCSYTNITDITARLSSFGTLRVRTGPQSNGLWFYGTFGLAVGAVGVSGVNTLSLFDNVSHTVVGLYSTPFSYSTTAAGLSGGVGIEGLITSNLRWKAEYIHLDLGSIGGGSFNGITVNAGRFTDDIVRIGLNLKFGNFYPPIVTNY
jgi:outer membrane immunogenic protein